MFTSGVGPNTLDTNVLSLLTSEVEVAGALKKANRSHVLAMYDLFHHMLATKERGLVIEPNESWDGLLDFCLRSQEFCSTCCVWVSVFLNSAPVQEISQQQNCVTLSVTEAELIAALTSLGLKVKTPMKLYVDNHGVADLVNNLSVSG